MIQENHSYHVMTGGNMSVLRRNLSRRNLSLQNNGVNPIYITFGRPAESNLTSFKLAAGAWVGAGVLNAPKLDIYAIGTAGDVLVVFEAVGNE